MFCTAKFLVLMQLDEKYTLLLAGHAVPGDTSSRDENSILKIASSQAYL
jgi:hypothetical protein